jgi:hypothetical protein
MLLSLDSTVDTYKALDRRTAFQLQSNRKLQFMCSFWMFWHDCNRTENQTVHTIARRLQ